MTAIRTMFEAGCYAVTSSSKHYLILDRFQKINVAKIDDFSLLFKRLRISQQKYFSIESLINASILFALAKEIGLQPGMFAEGDYAILDHCRSRISRDVMEEDHELLIQELIEGWQAIATTPLAKKYIKLGEYLCAEDDVSACIFSPMGGFALFVQDYFTGCMRAFIKDAPDELQLMMQFCSILHANVLGIGFHHNRFFRTELFLAQSALILPEMSEYREKLQTFIAHEKAQYEAFRVCCFTTVVGWAKIELRDIEEFAGAADAITELLEGRSFTSSNSDLIDQLCDLRQQLAITMPNENPLLRSCHFSGTKWTLEEQHLLIQEAIHYAVIDYAKEYIFKPYGTRPLTDLPLYYWAGQSEATEELLLAKLLNTHTNALRPFEWYAILQLAKNKNLIDYVQQMISHKSELEDTHAVMGGLIHLLSAESQSSRVMTSETLGIYSTTPIGAPVTHQYRRLEQVIKGSPAKRKIGYISLPPHHFASSSSPIEVDELANSLEETLNLQEPTGCLML